MSDAFADEVRELFFDKKQVLKQDVVDLSMVGKTEKCTGPRLHARDLKLGDNKGVFHLHRIVEPIRQLEFEVVGWCCDAAECMRKTPLCVSVSVNIDAIFNPMEISERLAPGRDIIIRNPVVTEFEQRDGVTSRGVLVEDPLSLEFPVVRERCFRLGCESAGPIQKCGHCKLKTYCTRVSSLVVVASVMWFIICDALY